MKPIGFSAIFALGVCGVASTAPAQTTTYTDETAFLNNTASNVYFESFNSVAGGPSAALDFGPTNGFSYNVDSQTPGTLFNGPGFISTNTSNESIIITFTGNDVTAVGGNFWTTDEFLESVPSVMIVELSDGTTEVFLSTSAGDFRGFTTDSAITSLTLTAQSDVMAVWTTLDNLYVGTIIPAPGGAALLLAPATLAIRRRR